MDTTLSQVIRLVQDAAATKAPAGPHGRQSRRHFCAGGHWHCGGDDDHLACCSASPSRLRLRGASACWSSAAPARSGLATPVAIMVGSGVGARHGILFKTAASLETTGYTDTVLLDKTGTVDSRRAGRRRDCRHPQGAGQVPARHGGRARKPERAPAGQGGHGPRQGGRHPAAAGWRTSRPSPARA